MPALPPWLVALPWAVPYLGLLRLSRRTPGLAEVQPDTVTPLSIIIPARNEAATIATVVESVLESTHAQLEELPSVSAALAGLIVENRPYQSVDDLARLSGMSAAKLAALRPLVKVAPAAEAQALAAAAPAAPPAPPAPGKIDLNTATQAELDDKPGQQKVTVTTKGGRRLVLDDTPPGSASLSTTGVTLSLSDAGGGSLRIQAAQQIQLSAATILLTSNAVTIGSGAGTTLIDGVPFKLHVHQATQPAPPPAVSGPVGP